MEAAITTKKSVTFMRTTPALSSARKESAGCPHPAEYVGMRILDREGTDVTEAFERGAALSLERAFDEARRRGETIEGAVLKANSPSCGSGKIYDGTFSGRLVQGDGCFAAKLKERGIKVISEKEINNGKF